MPFVMSHQVLVLVGNRNMQRNVNSVLINMNVWFFLCLSHIAGKYYLLCTVRNMTWDTDGYTL